MQCLLENYQPPCRGASFTSCCAVGPVAPLPLTINCGVVLILGIVNIIKPGQGSGLHARLSTRSGHSFPRFSCSTVTLLLLVSVPFPHVTEHPPHSPKSVTWQSTAQIELSKLGHGRRLLFTVEHLHQISLFSTTKVVNGKVNITKLSQHGP